MRRPGTRCGDTNREGRRQGKCRGLRQPRKWRQHRRVVGPGSRGAPVLRLLTQLPNAVLSNQLNHHTTTRDIGRSAIKCGLLRPRICLNSYCQRLIPSASATVPVHTRSRRWPNSSDHVKLTEASQRLIPHRASRSRVTCSSPTVSPAGTLGVKFSAIPDDPWNDLNPVSRRLRTRRDPDILDLCRLAQKFFSLTLRLIHPIP